MHEFMKDGFDRRELLRRGSLLGLSVTGAGSLLAACGGGDEEAAVAPETGAGTQPSEAAPPVGGTLRARTGNDALSLDPMLGQTGPEGMIAESVFEPLVGRTNDGKEQRNVVAQTFELADDGLSVHVVLKEGIAFHGGYGEVTAEDVKFTLERAAGIIDTGVESYAPDWWGALERVDIQGTHELTLVLKSPSAPFINTTLPSPLSGIISKKAYEERGAKGFAESPVGSGPYEFVRWDKEKSITLKRFEDWSGAWDWIDAPQWDEVETIVIADPNAAELALEAGEINYTDLRATSVARFDGNDAFRVSTIPAQTYEWIGMNILHPKLEDVRVRQALRLAFDIPAMIDVVYAGQAERARAVMPPGTVGYWEDAPLYERDVEAARALLDDAGVSNLQLTMTVPTTSTALAEIAQANLGEVGIQLEIDALEPGAFFVTGEENRSRQLFFSAGAWITANGDPNIAIFPWFGCDQIDVWNWFYWCDERFEEIRKESEQELDPERRAELVIEAQRLMDEAVIAAWVAFPDQSIGTPSDIDPTPAFGPFGRLRVWAARSV